MDILSYIVDNALILIPALNILGMMLKRIEIIPDKFIPLIILVFSLCGTFGIMGVSVSAAVQGVLVGGAAVYGNQIVKQFTQN